MEINCDTSHISRCVNLLERHNAENELNLNLCLGEIFIFSIVFLLSEEDAVFRKRIQANVVKLVLTYFL